MAEHPLAADAARWHLGAARLKRNVRLTANTELQIGLRSVGSPLTPVVGSLVWFILAPGSVAVLVPWVISDWKFKPPFFALAAMRWVGGLLILVGVSVLTEAFARFTLYGRGTPAPYMLTERLVVTGTYRYVRNPMYLAILAIVGGQAFLFGHRTLLGYAFVLWFAFHLFVVWYEEPSLRRRYGRDYEDYCLGVRRWWPRAHAWVGSSSG